jgi:hypothetical protein
MASGEAYVVRDVPSLVQALNKKNGNETPSWHHSTFISLRHVHDLSVLLSPENAIRLQLMSLLSMDITAQNAGLPALCSATLGCGIT